MQGFKVTEEGFRLLKEQRHGETVKNSRIRPVDKTLFEVLLSEDALLAPEMEARLKALEVS